MIDAQDKSTQALPLDEMPIKRKRGRPDTGKAMTPAEKQRAYRERQKQLRDQNSSQAAGEFTESKFEELRLIAVELGDRCKRAEEHRDQLHAEVQRLQDSRDKLIREVRELKQRDQNSNSGNALEGIWSLQTKKAGARTWVTEEKPLAYSHDGEPYDFAAMTGFVDAMNNGGHSTKYRAIRHDGLIYESEEKPKVKRHRDQPAVELIDNDE